MNLYQEHYKKTVLKDLSSRFLYLNCNQIAKLEKITVNIGIKNFILKKHITNALAIELITLNLPIVTKAKKNTVLLNLKKNSPNGFKLNLNKNKAYIFFQKLSFYVFPNFKANKKFLNISNNNSLSFSIKEIDSFKELTFFYSFFKNITSIDIDIKLKNITKYNNNIEILFFLTSFNLPILLSRK